MPTMTELAEITPLLRRPGPWTVAYVDGPGSEPQVIEEKKQDAVRRRLEDSGAPDADVEAIASALRSGTGLPAPSARYLLAADGEVVLDAALDGPRHGSEIIAHTPVPPLLPLLAHQDAGVEYLVVETGREGARLRWERAGRPSGEPLDVEGRTDALPKVQAGGWSHAKHQRTSEEIWKLNQREVAEAVDQAVREDRPAFVPIAGDGRARQLLLADLAEESRAIAVEVDVHTRAAGSDDGALESAIDAELDRLEADEVTTARNRAETDHGRRGAHGSSDVMKALQEAAVDTLILDERLWDEERTLDALTDVPWVDDGDRLGVGSLGRVPAADALARAALLTDARVLVELDEFDEPDDERESRGTREPLAALRWPAV
ncbi:Vms1/Ankzf1 family peptidyl-tRNA hydrolase [Microbacterium sp. M28]|uniref:baeRF2 domain-containing protein n=1 Tax=Microbacterium sp. M28 TaxID=2962064 RepID=UPI0021F4C929|nr:Vms1/Ankzf1 family peptidyl-tRNA hydrolase [Microbacterium sp. M28]UYO95959.1 Vms1/Ankzf1 family peptidyl-tRNA hydrolase [Microbacterium sp. M28]